MARVALVTGGTRGIGHAISIALKNNGYRVAASYAGNDAAAQAFQIETGIPVYKFDVGNYEATEKAIQQITKDVGPVDVLVNNAGITRDVMFHKMTRQQWDEVIGTNLNGLFNVTRQVWEGMRARKFGRVINISSINGQKGQMGQVNYSASKAGDLGFHESIGTGRRPRRHHGQRHLPRLHRDRDGQGGAAGRSRKKHPSANPGGAPRRAQRDRTCCSFSGLRRCRLHHRLYADRKRRTVSRRLIVSPAIGIKKALPEISGRAFFVSRRIKRSEYQPRNRDLTMRGNSSSLSPWGCA